ncbi:hypothetical protein [Nostoc sp. GT001]|uniref:hypothetical protein n=1 Tax=Nostoc sp. GT001 TaxID=3056647 RepID=UPI0025AACD13|nr:hypothetical protein [Nostoc sp. GT001]MDM9583332.1 hypothetical protein [Nostoc sp. GT001]
MAIWKKRSLFIEKGRGQEAQLAEGNTASSTEACDRTQLGSKTPPQARVLTIGWGLNPHPVVPSARLLSVVETLPSASCLLQKPNILAPRNVTIGY